MKRNNLAVLALVCFVGIGSGCRTVENIGIALHESIDAALSNKVDQLPGVTNMMPAVVKPDAEGCGCDLSKPLAIFASPVHGKNETEVKAWLRQRWASGIADNCNGLPRDVRPKAVLPSGKGGLSWKYGIIDGKLKIRFDGDNMALSCGDVTVDGLTQRWHFIGTSTHEDKRGWKDCKPGELTPVDKWAWFEVR
jgi:hypothetical protein